MYIKSVNLEGIKGFKNLQFDFERPDRKYAGWTVFVGGNASGKSTLLRGIALALVGPEASRELLGSNSSWRGWMHKDERRADANICLTWDAAVDGFRKGGKNPGPHFDAGVRFALENRETAHGIRDDVPVLRAIEKRSPKDTRILSAARGPWDSTARGWFSAGYGPMRRLTGSSSESMRYSIGQGSVSRFVTLFREDAALSESEAWLKTNYSRWLESKSSELENLLESVKELLGDNLLPQGMKISRLSVDHVYLRDGQGVELPMRDISDGCRGVYATVLDLIHSMYCVYGIDALFSRDSSGELHIACPGVVFIDEIEAHLHPSWQRDIPEWFKKHFPNVQFFVTTHSPLVAQAADANGVFFLPSHGDTRGTPHALDPNEIERLRLGRAEKTLLGVAFGLKTVRSNWANAQIEKWKRLNAKSRAGVPLNSPEVEQLSLLKSQMDVAFDEGPETV